MAQNPTKILYGGFVLKVKADMVVFKSNLDAAGSK